jgi:hypothetical protein
MNIVWSELFFFLIFIELCLDRTHKKKEEASSHNKI